jgi:capsid protein
MARPSRGWFASVAQTTRKWLGLPVHDAAGRGRRSLAWSPGNPGAVAAMLATQTELRAKSRDIARRNAWANAALESYVSNAIGTGIKPQSMVADRTQREAIHRLWSAWVAEADAAS